MATHGDDVLIYWSKQSVSIKMESCFRYWLSCRPKLGKLDRCSSTVAWMLWWLLVSTRSHSLTAIRRSTWHQVARHNLLRCIRGLSRGSFSSLPFSGICHVNFRFFVRFFFVAFFAPHLRYEANCFINSGSRNKTCLLYTSPSPRDS